MEKLLTISSILFSSTIFCQNSKVDLGIIDRKVRSIKTADAETLSRQLVDGYSTDLEKVRAIFRWVADNIFYKVRSNARHPGVMSKIKDDPADTFALKPLDERVADDVLGNGVAACDGYARLFKTLCLHAGIQAEVITGYARGSKGMRRFGSNHTWNVVFVDTKWELMDVTWASGYVTRGGDEFIQEFDENYFMPAPEKFIEEHYPDNLRWTLMDDPPLMPEFRISPYKQKTFVKYSIRSYSPAKGLLEAAEGDTLNFEIESANIQRDHNIFSDLFPDTSVYKTASSILLKPSEIINSKTSYTYHVNSPGIKWLYLLYNDDVILRYRLQIKDKKDLAFSN